MDLINTQEQKTRNKVVSMLSNSKEVLNWKYFNIKQFLCMSKCMYVLKNLKTEYIINYNLWLVFIGSCKRGADTTADVVYFQSHLWFFCGFWKHCLNWVPLASLFEYQVLIDSVILSFDIHLWCRTILTFHPPTTNIGKVECFTVTQRVISAENSRQT